MKSEIIGRQPRWYLWVYVGWFAFGFFFVLLPLTTPPVGSPMQAKIICLVLASIFCWVPGFLMCWLSIRTCFIADENGLRWRGMGRWKSASWQQVSDYFIKPMPKGQREFTVETANGNLKIGDLDKRVQLQNFIERHALWSQSKHWEEREVQSLEINGEEIFETDLSFIHSYPWKLGAMCCIVPLMIFANLIGKPAPNWAMLWATCQAMGWPVVIAMALTFLVMASLYPLMILAHYPRVRAMKERANQRISVSRSGIEWRNGADSMKARWDEITDFYIAPIPGWVEVRGHFVIETKRGTIEWVGLKNQARLLKLVAKYALNGTKKWGEKPKEKRQFLPDAPQIYNYRSREARALLLLMTFLVPTGWARAVVNATGLNPQVNVNSPADMALGWVFASAITLACLWAWICYWRFEIRLEASGFWLRNWRKTTFIAWPDITHYEKNSSGFTVHTAKQSVRFFGLIDGVDNLGDEIKKKSVNSLSRDW